MPSEKQASDREVSPEQIERGAEALKAGGLVVYPTESSYALGADATDENAILRVYQSKERDLDKPIPVIVADLEMWREYAHVTKEAEVLVAAFMPGPLTIVLKKKQTVPDLLNPLALAARIPSHSVALGLVRKTGFPITSTSANISGQPAAYSVEDLEASVRSAADVVLDAGPLPITEPSTIVDLTEVNKPNIIRKGPISEENILTVLMTGR